MTLYLITGRATGDRSFSSPYNVITNQMSVGQTVDLTLSTGDETTLENAGIITPAPTGHLYPG